MCHSLADTAQFQGCAAAVVSHFLTLGVISSEMKLKIITMVQLM